MYFWISALVGAFLSLAGPASTPDALIGTVRISGPVFLNGTRLAQPVIVTDGDRLETGPGGLATLSISATDRLTLGERSTIRLARSGDGIAAEVSSGRLQVNTSHTRLREVRLTDEGVVINAVPGAPRDYMVTRLANASYVLARHGGVTITDEGYGDKAEVPEGMVGTVRTEPAHADPPMPQQRPVSTAGAGRRAGSVTAIIPVNYINRGGSQTEAKKGSVINLQDEVESKERGRMRMVLDDGSILNLGSGSKMTIREHDSTTKNTTVELAFGRVRSQVVKLGRPDANWEVRTSTAICGVLGTDFHVETDGTSTKLIVYQGRVRFTPLTRGLVAAGAAVVTVIAGQTATSAAGAVGAPVASSTASTSAATASTAMSSQASTAAGTGLTSISRVGLVAAGAAPAAATGGILAANNTGNNDTNTIGNGSGGVSSAKPPN